MDSMHLREKMLKLRFPCHQMTSCLRRLEKLKLSASTSTVTSRKAGDTSLLKGNQAQAREILRRANEPYYKMMPYRNRSDNGPSWQYRILWHQPENKGCVACGANRIGKTEMGAFISALIVTGQHPRYESPRSGRMWIASLDRNVIEAVQQPYFEKIIPRRYKEHGKWNGKHNYWKLKSDGRDWEVWFKSYDSGRDKFQGDAIDFFWGDEEMKNPEDIWPEIETRLIDRQGIWLITATPVNGTRWLKKLMERENVYSTMAGMRENPYIKLSEIEKLARTFPKDEREVRIEGRYLIFGGRPVFDRELLSKMSDNKKSYLDGLIVAA